MASLKLKLVVATTIVVAYMHFPTKAYTTYLVGGARGWIEPPKPGHYEAWTKGKKFIKGDAFWFVHTYLNHTVQDVKTKQEYDACNSTRTKVLGSPRDGSMWVRLREPGVYYFFCKLHCAKGQKVIIDVKAS